MGLARWDAFHAETAARIHRIAFLISQDGHVATRTTLAVSRRGIARFVHWRSRESREAWALRTAARLAARWSGPARGSAGDGWFRLSARKRLALVLFHLEGLDPSEIAGIVQVSPRAAASLISVPEGEWSERNAPWRTTYAAPAPPLPDDVRGRVALTRLASALVTAAIVGTSVGAFAFVGTPLRSSEVASSDPASRPSLRRVERLGRCPRPGASLGFDDRSRRGAARAALAFNEALIGDDDAAVSRLSDGDGAPPEGWSSTGRARAVDFTYSAPAAEDGLAVLSCGRTDASMSWKVVIRDTSRRGEPSYAAYYLVRRVQGWRIWGSY